MSYLLSKNLFYAGMHGIIAYGTTLMAIRIYEYENRPSVRDREVREIEDVSDEAARGGKRKSTKSRKSTKYVNTKKHVNQQNHVKHASKRDLANKRKQTTQNT